MNCHQIRELFSDYAFGTLSHTLSEAANKHLSTCDECRESYVRFTATMKALDKMCEVKPPVNLHAAIMAGVAQSQAPKEKAAWWRIKWLEAFNYTSPKRAFAIGFAVLAMFCVINGFYPVKPAVNAILQTNTNTHTELAKSIVSPGGLWGSAYQGATGINMGFSSQTSSAGSVLAISIKSSGPVQTNYRITNLTNGQGDYGSISAGKSSVLSIASTSAGTTIARLEWSNETGSHSRYVFVPSKIDNLGSGKRTRFAVTAGNALETLKNIAATYGIAIISSGDVTRQVPSTDVASATPDDALYQTVAKSGYTWRALDSSTYLVEAKA